MCKVSASAHRSSCLHSQALCDGMIGPACSLPLEIGLHELWLLDCFVMLLPPGCLAGAKTLCEFQSVGLAFAKVPYRAGNAEHPLADIATV